ncbi:MAG TPA: PAN/Apple domain-containing protein, partial [Thermoanaerobaculia bacterium]|nr:PAN/Apple domain-containing protein [Thermoanaerobaculia bacterium]
LKDRVGSLQRNSDTVAGLKEDSGGPRPGRPSPWGDLSQEEGFDYRGGDYSDFPSRGAEACKAECRREARCRAYSYNLRTGTCYLKDRVGSLQRNSDTVSGAKGDDEAPGRPGGWRLSEERGFDHRGGDYRDFRARGVDGCKAECRDDRRCQAYSYNLRTSTCYLKDRVGSLERNADTVTGSRGGDSGDSGDSGWPGGGQGGDFREVEGLDSRGGDYHDFRARGPAACREECRSDRRCRAYTYNRSSETCYLKDRQGDLQPNRDTVSGIRQER